MPSVGLGFEIAVHPEALPAGFDTDPLLEALADFGPVLQSAVVPIVREAQIENFEGQGDPFGMNWAPLSPRTVAEKARLGFSAQPLVRTGKLAESLGSVVEETPWSVAVGVPMDDFPVPYPAYLDAGSQKRHLPARILIGFSDAEVSQLQEAIEGYLYEYGFPAGSVNVEVQESGAVVG